MDRDYLFDLFSEFGSISLRKMFSGFGITADGVNFAMALRAGIIFRVDELTIPRYDAEGARPFQYDTRNKTVVVNSYRHLPERLYDDPEELAEWAREAVGAAKRAAAKKSGVRKRAPKKKVAKSAPARSGRSKTKLAARKTTSAKAAKGMAKGKKAAIKRRSARKR